jgi:6-phosphofructokinase 1
LLDGSSMAAVNRVAVLTSGGDAPGMNAAIRAVVRAGCERGWGMFGVRHGYAGLLRGEIVGLGSRDVAGIVQRGGTTLGTSRCPEFVDERRQRDAVGVLEANEIDALVVIGGNGSQRGSLALTRLGVPVVGIASTIDNDLAGTDITLGVDTALGVALESIDRLKTTAASLERAFLVEVMGRDCGYLALAAGVAGGAESIVLPEIPKTAAQVAAELLRARKLGKAHALAVVAEGAKQNAASLAAYFREHRATVGFDVRVTSLGHVQRGGDPGVFDRLLGTRLGVAACDAIAKGVFGMLVGLREGSIGARPLAEVVNAKKALDPDLIRIAEVLAS